MGEFYGIATSWQATPRKIRHVLIINGEQMKGKKGILFQKDPLYKDDRVYLIRKPGWPGLSS